jgi:hypothetical protein
MQKLVNVLAVASFVVSGAVVVSGVYVYVNRDSIVDGIKSQVMDAVKDSMGDFGPLLGGSLGGGALVPETSMDLPIGGASAGAGLPVPKMPF